MANVWFCSDLHPGHRNIAKYRGLTEEDQYELLYKEWHSKVTKRDIVYVLGDCCFSKERLSDFSKWRGEKRLILGNHDTEHATIKELAEVFTEIHSLRKYKNFWLSHAPLHPDELRGRINIHGHCVDTDTEVLTKNGWKSYDNISLGDEIYSMNSNEQLEVDTVLEKIYNPNYDGEVFELTAKGISMFVTNKHRVAYQDNRAGLSYALAEDIFKSDTSLKLYKSFIKKEKI